MTSTLRPLELAEASVARLCHDLSGSLGTVLNALELAGNGDELAAEALALSAEAAREMAARLRLVRVLFGRDGVCDMTEVVALADGLPGRARISLHTAEMIETTLKPHVGRLLLCVLMLAAESLHGAGSISVSGDPGSDLVVMIDGPRAVWPAELAALLAGREQECDELDPRSLVPRLTALLAAEAQARMSLLLSTGAAAGPPPLLLTLRAFAN